MCDLNDLSLGEAEIGFMRASVSQSLDALNWLQDMFVNDHALEIGWVPAVTRLPKVTISQNKGRCSRIEHFRSLLTGSFAPTYRFLVLLGVNMLANAQHTDWEKQRFEWSTGSEPLSLFSRRILQHSLNTRKILWLFWYEGHFYLLWYTYGLLLRGGSSLALSFTFWYAKHMGLHIKFTHSMMETSTLTQI